MKIFKNQIVKICSYEKCADFYYYIEEKKVKVGFLKYEIKKVVHSPLLFGDDILLEDYKISSKQYIENDVIYFKPYCDIYLSNGEKEEKYFETNEELKNFVDELTKDYDILSL
jgi:hypothetical protein